jgi:hypothetical protein
VHHSWLCFACSFALVLLGVTNVARADDVPTFADRSDDAIQDADASFALMVAPLAVAFGVFGGEADFVVQRSLAVSVEAAGYRRDDVTLGAVGVGLLVYPTRMAFHELYLEPRVRYTRPLRQNLGGGPGALSGALLAGWQWTWDYGLSLRLGAGAALSSGALEEQEPKVSVGRLALVADASFGWAW